VGGHNALTRVRGLALEVLAGDWLSGTAPQYGKRGSALDL